jgi:hypothetical protein
VNVVNENRHPAGLHDDREHEARLVLLRHVPEGGVKLQYRERRPLIFVRENAENAISLVETTLHPSVDVGTPFDLKVVDMRLVVEPLQLLVDPLRALAIAARVADKDFRHAPPPRIRFSWALAPRIIDSKPRES